MLTITKKLDMSPHGVPQVIRVSQYDSDFTLEFKLFASGGNFAISTGTTAEIRGTKQSGTGYSASATLDTSTKVVTVAGAAQMTAVAGMNIFEIVLKKNNKEISSANFCLLVERAALDADTITDESVLKELNAIIESADTATQAAEEAEDAADRAEAAAQTLVIDPTPTQGSTNAVSSGGVYDEFANVDDFKISTFKNQIIYSRLTTYSMWTFGQEIVEGSGANATNNKAARTAYVTFDEPVLIILDNPDYIFVVWVYSSQSISGALYTPIKAYTNKPLIVLPKASTSYFRIGVKRADDAVLTTDYSDTTSDAYKILNALHTYTLTSQTLDNNNVPINAKAVKDNALVFKGFLDDNVDLNSVTDSGVYVLLSSRNYSNSPITVGYLFVYKIETVKMQVACSLGTSESFIPSVYIRYGSGSGSTISSIWRMMGRGRKTAIKMACFGDSIMYGQNGNTSAQVDEQYRIPSILAYNLNIDTTNYGVGSQGYIGLISEKAYDNIASKDLTQFNAMLMCYGVNDGYRDLGTWDSTDETTIMGQFNKIVAYVFSQNPSIRLIVVAPYNGRNVGTFPKYWYGDRTHPDGYVSRQVLSDTLKQACEYYNIPYIEQKNSPINGYTIQTLIGTDGVHPSLEGYFQLGAWLSGEVGRLIG